MKKICLLFVLVGLIATVEAKEKKEPVVMTIAGKEVPLSEFVFMAKQGNGVDFKNKKSVAEFVELYKILKLKVADAEAMTIHKLPQFDAELENLSLQLKASYLTDKSEEDSLLNMIYERTKVIPAIKHLYFSYPAELIRQGQILTKDTAALYEKALAACLRIKNGASFEETGESLKDDSTVFYWVQEHVIPLKQFPKRLDDCIFSMKPGDISEPVRSNFGYHLFKIDRMIPNPGKVKIAHVLLAFPSKEPTDDELEATRNRAEDVYQKALAGENFTELVKTFSDDSVYNKGMFPEFELGSGILAPLEKAAFALENIGDISQPVQTTFGFHVIKLIDRKTDIPFEEKASAIYDNMKRTEYALDMFRGFVNKTKERHGFVYYPEAYVELQRLADEYFPLDSIFVEKGIEMDKTLIHIDTFDFKQSLFVEYMYKQHRTTQRYSLDFMEDVFRYFEYEILQEIEKRSIERDYPEYHLTMQSYYDGTLLYEISNKRVWSRPQEEQEQLEAEWIKELNEKYPVTINWKVIKKIK